MLKPDERVLSCMRRLNSSEMAPLKEYLEGVKDETFATMAVMADEIGLRQHQGKVRFLCELLDNIEKAARI